MTVTPTTGSLRLTWNVGAPDPARALATATIHNASQTNGALATATIHNAAPVGSLRQKLRSIRAGAPWGELDGCCYEVLQLARINYAGSTGRRELRSGLYPALQFPQSPFQATNSKRTSQEPGCGGISRPEIFADSIRRNSRTIPAQTTRATRVALVLSSESVWLRGLDLNQRPLGYEPNELPGCSTPR